MLVKDVILSVVMELGRVDLIDYLSKGVCEDIESAKRDINSLVNCYNNIENEIALDFIKLKNLEQLLTEDGKIFYSSLSKTPVEIVKVYDKNRNEQKFEIYADYLMTEKGNLTLEYAYSPVKKDLTSTSEYTLQVGMHLLVYGVCAEFSIVSGAFDQASYWDKRYKRAIGQLSIKKPTGKMNSRRWL